MKRILLLLVAIGIVSFLDAQTKYYRAKIFTGEDGMKTISELGIDIYDGMWKKDAFFMSDFSEKDLNKLAAAGFDYDILIEDVSAYYVE